MIILGELYLLKCQDQSNHFAPVVKSISPSTILDFHSVSLVPIRDLQTDTGLLIICASTFFFCPYIQVPKYEREHCSQYWHCYDVTTTT